MELELSRALKNQLKRTPLHIIVKLNSWLNSVRNRGLRYTQTLKGFHDEPLKGSKSGRRSIRLSKKWRAEYSIHNNARVELIIVEEVHPHDY